MVLGLLILRYWWYSRGADNVGLFLLLSSMEHLSCHGEGEVEDSLDLEKSVQFLKFIDTS